VARLIGIAKLAAESPSLEAKRRVEYRELATRSLLSKCDSLRAVVNLAPILPWLNDSDPSIDAVAKASARAGAAGLNGNVVYLKDCAKQVFFPFLETHYPQLVRLYRERFDRDAYLRGAYPDLIRERIRRVRQRYGLERADQPQPEFWPATAQLALFT
jgi:DNA repair photolyase